MKCNKRKNKKLFSFLVAYLRVCRFEKDQPEKKTKFAFGGGGVKKKSFTMDVSILMDKNIQKYKKVNLKFKQNCQFKDNNLIKD